MNILFLTPLIAEDVSDKVALLHEDFIATADGVIITVPKGFATDFCSVPRIPFAYEILGGIGRKAGLLHDYKYSAVCAPALKALGRAWADNLLYDALQAQGVSKWKAWLMWSAVRAAGSFFYQPLTFKSPAIDKALPGSAAAGAFVPAGVETK